MPTFHPARLEAVRRDYDPDDPFLDPQEHSDCQALLETDRRLGEGPLRVLRSLAEGVHAGPTGRWVDGQGVSVPYSWMEMVAAGKIEAPPTDIVQWAVGDAARELRRRESKIVAGRIRNLTGKDLRRKSSNVSAVNLFTGEVENLCAWQNCCIIPEVAYLRRIKDLGWTTLYLSGHPKAEYLRYAVLTSGPRIPLSEARERWSIATRRLSKCTQEAWDRFGIEFVFRSVEAPARMDFIENGAGRIETAHIHINLGFIPHRLLSESDWRAFLDFLRADAAAGFMVHDSGRVRNLNELIKYVIKGDEVAALTNHGLVDYFDATWHKRPFQLLGNARKWKSEQRRQRRRPIYSEADKSFVLVDVARHARPEETATVKEKEQDSPQICDEPPAPRLLTVQWRKKALPVATPYALVANYDPDRLTAELAEAHQLAKKIAYDRMRLDLPKLFALAERARAAIQPLMQAPLAVAQARLSEMRKGNLDILELEVLRVEAAALFKANQEIREAKPSRVYRSHLHFNCPGRPSGTEAKVRRRSG